MTKIFTFQDRSSVIDFLEKTKVVFPHGAELITTSSKFNQEETDQKDGDNKRIYKYIEGLYKHLFTCKVVGNEKKIVNDGYFDENGEWCPQLEIFFWNDLTQGYTGRYMVRQEIVDMVVQDNDRETTFNVWFGGMNGKDMDLSDLMDLSVPKKSNDEVSFNEEVYNGEVKVEEKETEPSVTVEEEKEKEDVRVEEKDVVVLPLEEAKEGDLIMLGKSLEGVYFKSFNDGTLQVYTQDSVDHSKEGSEVETNNFTINLLEDAKDLFYAFVPKEIMEERNANKQAEQEKLAIAEAEAKKKEKLQKLLDSGFTLEEIKDLIK